MPFSKKTRQERIAKGLCSRCCKKPKDGRYSRCKDCIEKERQRDRTDYSSAYYHAHKKDYIDWRLRRTYGITFQDYSKLRDKQKGKCAICGKKFEYYSYKSQSEKRKKKAALGVDHCHTTNKVRGLLCMPCNRGLGNFNDSPDLLKKALEYLNSPPATRIV